MPAPSHHTTPNHEVNDMNLQQWTTPKLTLEYQKFPGGTDTLVFLPGTFLDHRMFGPQVEEFQGRYTLLVLDLPSFGTEPVSEDPLFPHFSEALHTLLLKEGQGSIHLVGHSLGGALAQDYVLRFPEAVDSLTLMESSPLWKSPCFTSELRMLKALGPGPRLLPLPLLKGHLLRNYPARAKSLAADSLDRLSRSEVLAFLTRFQGERGGQPAPSAFPCPLLVVYGEKESLRGQLCGEAWQDQEAHLLDVVSGASTHPSMEQPREFNEKLQGFLLRTRSTDPAALTSGSAAEDTSEEPPTLHRDLHQELLDQDRRALQEAVRQHLESDPLLPFRSRLPKEADAPLLPPTAGGISLPLLDLLDPRSFHALHLKHLLALKIALDPALEEASAPHSLQGRLLFHEEVLVALSALEASPAPASGMLEDLHALLEEVTRDLLSKSAALRGSSDPEDAAMAPRGLLTAARSAFALDHFENGRTLTYAALPHLDADAAHGTLRYLATLRDHMEASGASAAALEAELDLEAAVVAQAEGPVAAEDYLRNFLHYRFLRNRFIERALDLDDYAAAWELSAVVLKEGAREDPKTQDRYLSYGEKSAKGLGDRIKEMDILTRRVLWKEDMDAYLALQRMAGTAEWAAQRAGILTHAADGENPRLLPLLKDTEAALLESLQGLAHEPEAFFREQAHYLTLFPRETRMAHRQILLAMADEAQDDDALAALAEGLGRYADTYGGQHAQRLLDTLVTKYGHRRTWKSFPGPLSFGVGTEAQTPAPSAAEETDVLA